MKAPVAYGICVVALATIGLGMRWGLAERQQEARLTASHVGEVEGQLARMPPGKGRAVGTLTPGSIGTAVEAAAKQSGLDSGSVHEVKPASGTEGVQGLLAVYRIRLVNVRPERLVKFVYLLESQDSLRTTELDLERQSLQAADWDASLLVVRAL